MNRKFLQISLIAALVYGWVAAMAQPVVEIDPAKTLSGRYYRIDTRGGVLAVTMMPPGTTFDDELLKLILSGLGKNCTNNVLALPHKGLAQRIPGSDRIAAFLECLDGSESGHKLLVQFAISDLSSPLCFSRAPSFGEDFLIGTFKIVKGRKDGVFAVIEAGFGDAGFHSKSVNLVHISITCELTLLHQTHASSDHATDDSGFAEGNEVKFRIFQDGMVEISEFEYQKVENKKAALILKKTSVLDFERLMKMAAANRK